MIRGVLVLAVAGACGSAAPPARASENTEAPATESVLESSRRAVRTGTEWLARTVDGWFGDKPLKEGGHVSDGRLGISLLKRQDEGADFGLRFNARLEMPNVEESAYLFLGRDNRQETVADTPGVFSRQQRLLAETAADQSFFAGLGIVLVDSVDFRLGLRGGLKPYAQLRYRRPWELGPMDRVELRETVFWSPDERFGSTTALSYEHLFSSTLAARWLSAATITQATPKFDWGSSLGAYKMLGAQRLLSLEALVGGQQGSGVKVADIGLQVRWEQPVHEDWLRAEISLGHFWPRKEAAVDRSRAWAVGTSLKLRF